MDKLCTLIACVFILWLLYFWTASIYTWLTGKTTWITEDSSSDPMDGKKKIYDKDGNITGYVDED